MRKSFETFEEHIAHVESWLSGEQDRVAADLLKKRGVVITPARELSESRLRKSLHELIDALASEKIYLDCTDHLSDRDLYEKILADVLPHNFAVGGDDWSLFDFSEVYDDESREIFLAYYADDKDRVNWADEEAGPMPAKRALPYDRDRKLPRPSDWNEVYA